MKIYVRKREKNWKKSWTWISIMSFSPHIWERGDLFSKTQYLNSSVFLPTSVNQAQDFMCLKFKSNFKYKLHPSVNTLRIQGIKNIYFRYEERLLEQGLKSVTTVEFKWMKDETLSEDFVKVKKGMQASSCFVLKQHIIRIFLFSVCCSRLSLKR